MDTDIEKLGQEMGCTDEQMHDFKEAFDTFDKDHSGAISKEELGLVMRNLNIDVTDEELKDLIREHDEDSSGQIEFNEFCHLMKRHLTPDAKEEMLRTAFKTFDTDGSGKISSEELKGVMKQLGENLTECEISEMIRAADIDGDGQINYEEFVQMMCSTKS